MKYLLRGLALGVSINITTRICGFLFGSYYDMHMLLSGIIFYIIITLFLLSDNISHMFLTGFSGIFFMFLCELTVFSRLGLNEFVLMAYISGMYASVLSIITATVLIHKGIKISGLQKKEEIIMERKIKIKLLAYMAVMAVLFPYLVLPEKAGISVPLFAVMQFVFLWFIVPDRKRLILYIPIFIMSLNRFISDSNIWLVSNFILSIVLYCCIFIKFDIKKDTLGFVSDITAYITAPLFYFNVPFEWISKITDRKASVIKRIALALIIAVPCCTVLIITLSKADMVFSVKTRAFLGGFSNSLNVSFFVKIIIGVVISIFFFGAVYNSYKEQVREEIKLPKLKGDLIIINIVLSAILFVYTMFVVIQFKYLFAGKVLPDGFTYTEYARKGFFELLALTAVNIAVILTVIKLIKTHSGGWCNFTKALCHYLCAVTVVLLVSSYFRMRLYVVDDGLTRLRIFVIVFLVFEMIGLLLTFLYIAKPEFNLLLVYFILALSYYSLLNVMPTDYIIAKNQIDKYLNGTREDISYVFTLSADTAPAFKELTENINDENVINNINEFLKDKTLSEIPQRWQRFNLSVENAKRLLRN